MGQTKFLIQTQQWTMNEKNRKVLFSEIKIEHYLHIPKHDEIVPTLVGIAGAVNLLFQKSDINRSSYSVEGNYRGSSQKEKV